MPSRALRNWQTRSRKVLDEVEAAHAVVGGGRGARSFARQQINQAYVVLLSSQFQRFCRDLHDEAADFLFAQPAFASLAPLLKASLSQARRLDSGNPNPGNIASDFSRFGFDIWVLARERNARTPARRMRLEVLNRWRNAVAHQDFRSPHLGGRETVRLAEVREWRAACGGLAVDFDGILGVYLNAIGGAQPW
ncbi:hypothetical protein SAMN05216486_11133 [bacterium JGI 053]|nr:hypothetical protein SAMN05216486_11133 [bacterium JGI 053]